VKKILVVAICVLISSALLAQFGGPKPVWVYGKVVSVDLKKPVVKFKTEDGVVLVLKTTKNYAERLKRERKIMRLSYKKMKDGSFTIVAYEINPALPKK
jgi:hypothetical protein